MNATPEMDEWVGEVHAGIGYLDGCLRPHMVIESWPRLVGTESVTFSIEWMADASAPLELYKKPRKGTKEPNVEFRASFRHYSLLQPSIAALQLWTEAATAVAAADSLTFLILEVGEERAK